MGSPNGLWTAVSGGMAQSQNLDIIANNLANVNTTGFKKDSPTFKEYLASVERTPSVELDMPRTVFKDSDFYHTDGREHAMVNVDKVHTDHSQSNLKPSNGAFDLAIDGPGFFAVKTPAGIHFTRAGEFKISANGDLVTNDGYAVLARAENAEPSAADNREPASVNPFSPAANLKTINLKNALENGRKVLITNEGKIYSGEEQVGTLAVAEFSDPRLLKKISSTLFANQNPVNIATNSKISNVRQGFLEASNVNPVSELVELLKANRLYESNMKAIKAYNDMAGKEANEVGKL